MLQSFRNRFSVPPGRRWFYQVPGGNFVESVFGMDDCMIRASAAYREIGEDVPANLDALIEDFMCQSLPDGFCTGKPTVSNPTWNSVLHATQAMVKKAEAAGKAGPQMMQELERRVKICQACPEHSVSMCITCSGLLSAFDAFRRGRRTALDRNVRVCRAAHGLLPAMIHLDPDCVSAAPGFTLPAECWAVKKES
jgi:hypothetical protein